MKFLIGKLVNKDKDIKVILYNEENLKDYIFSNMFDMEDIEFCMNYYLYNYLSDEKTLIHLLIPMII